MGSELWGPRPCQKIPVKERIIKNNNGGTFLSDLKSLYLRTQFLMRWNYIFFSCQSESEFAYTVRYEEGGGTVFLRIKLFKKVVWGVEPGHTGKVLVSLRFPHYVVQSLGALFHILCKRVIKKSKHFDY